MAIRYFSEPGAGEDFIVDTESGDPLIIQVSATLSTPGTRERELRGAEAAMMSLGVDEATVVMLHETDHIGTAAGSIHVVPAWRWLLD